jgi:subtilisin-like proprotein convertase family protein
MKNLVKLSMILVGAFCDAQLSGAVLNFGGSPARAIPDNDPTGLAFAFTATTPLTPIESVVVTLNISGGFNGDLYAYLTRGSEQAILLNRVGVTGVDVNGYPDAGMNVSLSSGVFPDIHQYRVTLGGAGIPTGTWSADGRLDPVSATRNNTLDVFTGTNPNGDWTLFVSDVSAGSIATLNAWSVDITVVPEPIGIALLVFASLFAGIQGARFLLKQRGENRGN